MRSFGTKRLSAIIICLLLACGTLAGCGGNDDGGSAQGGGNKTIFHRDDEDSDWEDEYSDWDDEASSDVYDFLGGWKYVDFDDLGIQIYDNGEFEWISGGEGDIYRYYINEDGELVVTGMYTYSVDGEYLVDDEGSMLEPYDWGRDWETDDIVYGPDDFIGMWESYNSYLWLTIYDDGTYALDDFDGYAVGGEYEIDGDTLILDDGSSFTINSRGELMGVEDGRDKYFSVSEDDAGSYYDDDYDVDYYTGGYEEYMDAAAYCGCWESNNVYKWLCLYENGTYEMYDEDGLMYSGSYEVDGFDLYLDDGSYFIVYGEHDYMGDYDGNVAYFRSELPDYEPDADSGDLPTAEVYYGTWEEVDDYWECWLTIYSDGSYFYIWSDYICFQGDYTVEDGVLVMENGQILTIDESGDFLVDDDGDRWYASEVPSGYAHLLPR